MPISLRYDVGRLTDLGNIGSIFHETTKNNMSWQCHGITMIYGPGKWGRVRLKVIVSGKRSDNVLKLHEVSLL